MNPSVEEIDRFSRAIESRFGHRLADRAPLTSEVMVRRAAHHRESIQAYLQRIERAEPDEWRALATAFSVGETYFFRHIEQFLAFGELLGPLSATRPIRVLSAGCSTGEEAYTLAIVTNERAIDPRKVTIDAIDFNPGALATARNGVYGRWALRATSREQEARWFGQRGREVVLDRSIVSAVTFSEGNLLSAATWQGAPWDFVFCRNVMMYFNPQAAAVLVERIVQALAPGGHLFLGHAETLRDYTHDLELCHTHGTFYYRRRPAARIKPVTVPPPNAPAADPARWVGDIAESSRRIRTLIDRALATPKASQSSVEHIRQLIREERFIDARNAIDALDAPSADAKDARLMRAIIAAHTGDVTAAREGCQVLLAAGHHVSSAHYLLAICESDPAASERHARDALDADPNFAMASVRVGFLARRRGGRATATDFLARAIVQLEKQPADDLAMFSGGFSRTALIDLCRAELAAAGGGG